MNQAAVEHECVLVLMSKAPRPGRVKTRLSPALAPEVASSLFRCLLADSIALACSLSATEPAIMCPASDLDELKTLAGGEVTVVAQTGSGLADGLTSVFAHFTAGRVGRRVIAFNSDSPHLPRAILEQAFERLLTHDLVVGPTDDGGYYLVGAKQSHAELFANDGMGSHSALERLLAQAAQLGLSVATVEPFYDIDLREDLTRLAAELEASPERAPRTAAWLRERLAPADS